MIQKAIFDNNNGKDYHIETAAETDGIVEDNSREAQIDREYKLLAEKRREKNEEDLTLEEMCGKCGESRQLCWRRKLYLLFEASFAFTRILCDLKLARR